MNDIVNNVSKNLPSRFYVVRRRIFLDGVVYRAIDTWGSNLSLDRGVLTSGKVYVDYKILTNDVYFSIRKNRHIFKKMIASI